MFHTMKLQYCTESLIDQIAEVKRKEDVKLTIDGLTKEAGKCYDDIAEENDPAKMQLGVLNGNSFRKAIGEKRKLISDMENALEELEEEKLALKSGKKSKK